MFRDKKTPSNMIYFVMQLHDFLSRRHVACSSRISQYSLVARICLQNLISTKATFENMTSVNGLSFKFNSNARVNKKRFVFSHVFSCLHTK
jgi:hypothetical protein